MDQPTQGPMAPEPVQPEAPQAPVAPAAPPAPPVAPPAPVAPLDSGKSHSAWVAYLLGWLTGLFFFFTTKDNFVKFHAAQSIIVFGGINIIQMFLGSMMGFRYYYGYGNPLSGLVNIVCFVLWIFLMIKAHKGERYKLPVVGDWAEQWATK